MSQHNIIGSEAFDKSPSVIVRAVRPGGLRRRRARQALAIVTVLTITAVGGAVAGGLMVSGAFAGL